MDKSIDKPLITFILFAYNHEKYIREAVEGALAQIYSPLEIILSDDCSTDKTFKIIQNIANSYTGQHQLIINRNEKNLGLAEHVNKLFDIAKGEIIVLSAGDDISLPHRVFYSQMAFENNPELKFVDVEKMLIDENGCLKNQTFTIHSNVCQTMVNLDDYMLPEKSFRFNGAGRALHSSVVKDFGPLLKDTPTEDTTYLLRSLMTGDGMILNIPGVLYRQHGANLSGDDSLPYISIDNIYNQYIVDINKALSSSLITQNIHTQIINRIEKSIERRRIYNGLYFAENKVIYTVLKILPSPLISINDKINLFKRIPENLFKKLKKALT